MSSTSELDGVVTVSEAQRFPLSGEPVCVLCGRYGEYICDKTDEDVCSIECRDRALERAASRALQQKFGITVTGAGVDILLATEFHLLHLHDDLYANMQRERYDHPTPVQMQVLPYMLQHRHLVVGSPTGTGKTLAYLIPLVAHVIDHRMDVDVHHIIGVILAPVRELCVQLETQAKALMKGIPKMKTALLVGGIPLPNQLHRLKKGVQLIVATPGRLYELVTEFTLDLSHVVCCVLDEVDMLVDAGDFESKVVAILAALPLSRQMVLVSATITPAVLKFAQTHLHEAIHVSVASTATSSLPNSTTRQVIHYVDSPEAKKQHFFAWLQAKCVPGDTDNSILVFVSSKVGADMLAKSIVKACNIPALAIHSEKTQAQRLSIIQSFVDGAAPILVSTGVLGRGMNLLSVDDVVVFDLPPTIEEYVHLIGRAGRQPGSDDATAGTATVYIGAENTSLLPKLLPLLRKHDAVIPDELKREAVRERTRAMAQRQSQVQDASKSAYHAARQMSTAQHQARWQQWAIEQPKRKVVELTAAQTQHKKFKFIAMS
ncbi:hypothetical protein H310_10797 [Aphanomyces invadans]|uniref:RNA helicase n=1 Tax=Aphanomyces invadans TaxID=157072 RepID=A0A024TNX6_9STRA|nr:hypothetical protein H310_10797 [Aphanomyces invadans]ETV95723.1 hypothetical protein H310_10797 [Aphanomyces invadans]|eukprot:XP_008875474.1 hypothetical protein H310_10797 [Aphanomyces invadans]